MYHIAYYVITSERNERRSYWQPYIGRQDSIQTALKALKNSEKMEVETIFVKSFKTMNWTDLTRPSSAVRLFDFLFIGKFQTQGCEILK